MSETKTVTEWRVIWDEGCDGPFSRFDPALACIQQIGVNYVGDPKTARMETRQVIYGPWTVEEETE